MAEDISGVHLWLILWKASRALQVHAVRSVEELPLCQSDFAVLEALLPYVERHLQGGGRLNNITRHILGLYHGRPRARAFRRHLPERAPREGAGVEVLREAIRIAEGESAPALAAAE